MGLFLLLFLGWTIILSSFYLILFPRACFRISMCQYKQILAMIYFLWFCSFAVMNVFEEVLRRSLSRMVLSQILGLKSVRLLQTKIYSTQIY